MEAAAQGATGKDEAQVVCVDVAAAAAVTEVAGAGTRMTTLATDAEEEETLGIRTALTIEIEGMRHLVGTMIVTIAEGKEGLTGMTTGPEAEVSRMDMVDLSYNPMVGTTQDHRKLRLLVLMGFHLRPHQLLVR